jgi:hypothetical protein
MCNCIEEMEAKLQQKTGDSEAFIPAQFDFEHDLRRFYCKGLFQRKGNGKHPSPNFMSSHIPFDYCPFCGKKYIEEAKNADK